MHEQSKAAKRRFNIGAFHARYFAGHGLDVGSGSDPLVQYIGDFCLMKSAESWDRDRGDAQYLRGLPANHYDFLHASHCLEHLRNIRIALKNWSRVVKPGGYLIITVPDEDMYEQGRWPSTFNDEHKWTFTIHKRNSWSPQSINCLDLAIEFSSSIELEKLELQRDFHRSDLRGRFDQTARPAAECSIEMVFRKRSRSAK